MQKLHIFMHTAECICHVIECIFIDIFYKLHIQRATERRDK